MSKAREALSHVTMILSVVFAVFLILDQFNPMMNFIDNGISRVLLGVLCASGIAHSVLQWMRGEEKK